MARKRPQIRPQISPPAASFSWTKGPFVLKALAILLAGAWALSPTLRGSWYGDDQLYLGGNPLLYDPARLWKAWFQPGSFVDYYPLEQTVQWYQWQLWGTDSPRPYLVCNLVLHLASALLVWHLFSKLGLKLAWLGGLLFAIHPLMVDTVGVSSELKNTLSLPPFLLAMCAYLDFEQSREKRPYRLALLLFLVAMLCKITMAFFPLVIVLYAWWKRGRITWADGKAALPFLVISIVLGSLLLHAGVVYARATHYVSPGPIHLGGPMERLALAGLCLVFYFGHSFLPLHPLPYYPLWPLEPLTPWLLLPWLTVAPAALYCWRKRDSWGRPVLFALGFFVLGLAPFLGLKQASYMCLTWVQDHFLYIPIIALIGLVVAGAEGIARRLPEKFRPPAISLLVLVIALLGLQTHSYAKLFADHEQLWRYNLRYNPDMWMVRHLYATELTGVDDQEAIAQERESVRLNPNFDNAQMTLGLELFKTGNLSGAIDAFQKCLQANPHYDGARLFLGLSLTKAGRSAEALEPLTAFVRAHPQSSAGHLGLAQALAKEHRIPDAIAELESAQQLDPANFQISQMLAQLRTMDHDATGKK
jgi:hypothetical protein